MTTINQKLDSYCKFACSLINPNIQQELLPLYLTTKLLNELIELRSEIIEGSIESIIDEAGDCCWYFANEYKRQNSVLFEVECYVDGDPLIPLDLAIRAANRLNQYYVKNIFHNKPLPDDLIHDLWEAWEFFNEAMNLIGITLEKIIDFNTHKLSDRHGTSYNKDFYSS